MKRNGSRLIVLILVLAALGPLLVGCVPRDEDESGQRKPPSSGRQRWLKRHEDYVVQARKGDLELLFVGASIVERWQTTGKLVWQEHFAPLKAASFGIGGDRTVQVLWRLQNGELDGLQPKLVVLNLGGNDLSARTGRRTPEQTAAGVAEVVQEVRKRVPAAKILLLGIFPRSPKDARLAQAITETNALLAKLDDGARVKYLDLGPKFLNEKGELTREIMSDYIHPTARGYEIWAQAILGTVKEMMGADVAPEKK